MNEQYHLQTAKKRKVRLPLSAYLSYLLIATLLFTGVSFSKYATTGSADDSAQVALVMLDAGKESDPVDMEIMNGVTQSACQFYVTNGDSEVALEYTITISLPEALPTGVTMALLDAQGSECTLVNPENTYTYTYTSTFAAGTEAKHAYALTFTGDENTVTGNYTIEGIQISVTAEQIN